MFKLVRRLRFLFNVRQSIPFIMEFFLSNLVPTRSKVFVLLFVFGYLVLPLDIIPDFLGFFGILDDVTILTWILQRVVQIAPQQLKDKYQIKA